MFTELAAEEPGRLEGAVEGATDSFADLLLPYVPESLEFIVVRLVSPGLTILLILLVALVLSRLARRGIDRGVARMKGGDAGARRRRWLRRIGLDAADAVVEEDLRRTQRAEALGSVGRSLTSVAIWAIAVIMVLAQVNVQVGPLIAGAGVIGVALGFGAQDLVKDFLSGVFMLIEDQYGIGDIVNVGEAEGVVESISLRSTRIRDVNGTLWHVPNGEIRRVGNMSQEWARALLDVSVAYGADTDAVGDLIQRVAAEMSHEEAYQELFLAEPDLWGVQALGADAVDLRLVIKVVPGKQWAILRELRRRIKIAMDDADIEIPFPQRTVWLRTEQPLALGDQEAERFGFTVPDEATRQHAVAESTRGASPPLEGDLDDVTPTEADLDGAGPADDGRR